MLDTRKKGSLSLFFFSSFSLSYLLANNAYHSALFTSCQATKDEVHFVATHADGAYSLSLSMTESAESFGSRSGKYSLVRTLVWRDEQKGKPRIGVAQKE